MMSVSLSEDGLVIARRLLTERIRDYRLPKVKTLTDFVEQLLLKYSVKYSMCFETDIEEAIRYNLDFPLGLPFKVYLRLINSHVWQIGCYFHPRYLVHRFDFIDTFDEMHSLGEYDRPIEYHANGYWALNLKWRCHYNSVKRDLEEIIAAYSGEP